MKLFKEITTYVLVFVVFIGLGYGINRWFNSSPLPPESIAGDFTAEIQQFGGTDRLLIVAEGCPACSMASEWLASKNVQLPTVDIRQNEAAKVALENAGFRSTPTLLLRDRA